MNCKQGDLAIHVGGYSGIKSRNAGKIVRCVRFLGEVPRWQGLRWEIEGGLIYSVGGKRVNHADDKYLRPIRDNPGEDEMLRIAGKPHEVAA